MPKRAALPLRMTKEQTEAWRRAGERYRARRRAKKDKRGKKTQPGTSPRATFRRRIGRPPPGQPKSIRVVIFTYERPDSPLALLRDVYAWRGPYRLSVAVYDDASKADYAAPRAMMKALGWDFVRARRHHGKEHFWRWVKSVHGMQRNRKEEFFVFLPDDVRLCVDFFSRLCVEWLHISDPNKISLSPLIDSGGNRGWTQRNSRSVGNALLTGCVDLAAGTTRAYLEALDHSCPSVPSGRWAADPSLGSGVGAAISSRLHSLGLSMYSVKRSLIAHTGLDNSQMNPTARKHNPLRSLNFVDGDHAHSGLLDGDPCIVSIASMGYRNQMLSKVIDSLYWQAERINVYLNEYDSIPRFLQRPNIRVAMSQQHGDRGDAGKFFWSDQLPTSCYHFTCDDDIIYPSDYVARMRYYVDAYKRRALISLHGAILHRFPPSSCYYNKRASLLRCTRALSDDTPAHIPGTGVLAYHVSTMDVAPSMFKRPNMADIWLGLAAKKAGVPIVVVHHERNWISTLSDPMPNLSIFARFRDCDAAQAALVHSAAPWSAPTMPELAT